jgi:RHS repeat-associated protein
VTARDGDGNVGTQSWTVTIPFGGTTNLSYDADGNTLSDPGHTYTYDPLDRLSTVTWPDGSTLSITYDPLGLRNEEVLKNSSGTVIADNKLLWQGGKIVSDGTNNYWSFGQTTGNSQYYFGTDHLGSLRDVTDANCNPVTEYDYDLWGNRNQVQGTQAFSSGFTGHWSIKDLVLAPYRVYNPYLGRWINRDPIREKGGINLYGYVGNDPVNEIDPQGLDAGAAGRDASFWHDESDGSIKGCDGSYLKFGAAWQKDIIGTIFGGIHDAPPNQMGGYSYRITDSLLGAALPMTGLRGSSIEIFSYTTGQTVIVPIVDSGPHAIDDPYWLNRDRPRAENTQNKSGLDMTPQTIHDLGIPTKVIESNSLRSQGYPNGLIILNVAGDAHFNWRFVK